jgi:hypothetical protein
VGCTPGARIAAPVAGSKQLVHWTSKTWYWSEIAGPAQAPPPPTSNFTGGLTITVLREGGGPARSGMEPGEGMCDHS